MNREPRRPGPGAEHGGAHRPVRWSDDGLAPVIPLFGDHSADRPDPVRSPDDIRRAIENISAAVRAEQEGAIWSDAAGAGERAERTLVKRLHARQLSVSEARGVLVEHGVGEDVVEAVLERFGRLGYLDDAVLAEQLVRAGSERKGQGRTAIAQTLAKRGIPRDVADTALSGLPDDDAERALEFARAKVRALSGVDRETAQRRLVGQLSRRGYNSSVSLGAARQAVDERG